MALDLSNIGKPKGSVTLAVNTAVGATIEKFTGKIISNVQANYDERVRSRSGALSKSVRPETEINGSNATLRIYADDYLDFVDQGVTGVGWSGYKGLTQYREVHKGKFQFKNLQISRGMVDNIERFWIASAGMSIPSGLDPRSYAIMIAKNIKRRGIKATRFFSDAIDEVSTSELQAELSSVMRKEITVELKEYFRK